jgi:hypothetical protein
MTASLTIKTLAAALEGRVVGNVVIAPFPGGRRFRQLRARLDPLAPHGFFATPVKPGDGTAEEAFQYILSRLGEPSCYTC